MQSNSISVADRALMTTGMTKMSDRMTWKQLQQCVRDKNDDFSKLLAQNFLLLHQQAKDKNDSISEQTLNVIITGLVMLTKAIDERKASKMGVPVFTAASYSIFSRLAESYNSPAMLKQAGLHYMAEWHLPEAALIYFQRAQGLGANDNAIQSLVEVATIAVQRKEALRKGKSAKAGVTAALAPNPNVNKMIRQTSKLLIMKTQRPSPQAAFVMGKNLKAKATAALPDPIKEGLKEAGRELTAGNLPAVHKLLVKVSRHPVKKEILCGLWSNLGRAWYQAGNHVEMEEAYSQAYVCDPKGSDTYFNLALAKNLNQKIAEAETLYQMAVKMDPANPKVWCNLGVLYFQNDRFKEAEDAFRSALKYRPDYARAWDNLASALSAQEMADEAIEACHKAIQYRPGYPEAYFKLSAIYFGKGDPASLAEAASALSYVVNYSPLAASATAMLSMIHSRLEQVDSAKASLQRAVAVDPKCVLLPTVWTELETAIRSSPTE